MNRFILTILVMFTVNICNAAVTVYPAKDYGAFTVSPQIDFGIVASGSDLQPEITIFNTGVNPLQLGDIASTDPVDDPYRLVDGGCANSVIQPGAHCSIMVLFGPSQVPGIYPDSFNIEIVSENISHIVTLNGEVAALSPEPDIQVSFSSVNFRTVDVLQSTDSPYFFPPPGSLFPTIAIMNIGSSDLNISSISVTGIDKAEANFQDNCTDILAPGESCGFLVEFKPLTAGIKNAAITIVSNDPDEATFNFLIGGVAAGENDGVPAVIEDAGPNNGDGNNDDILDSNQSNVVTLVDSYNHYVTYLTQNNSRFKNMSVSQQIEVPTDFVIGSGVFDFTLEQVTPGQVVEIGLILPAGVIPTAYYLYGPTTDIPVKHWYKFDFDGETGAVIFGNVVFTTSTGTRFTRSVLNLIVQDGGRGDADMTVNGVIAMTAAMPVSTVDSSGAINLWYTIFTFLLIMLSRRTFTHCVFMFFSASTLTIKRG